MIYQFLRNYVSEVFTFTFTFFVPLQEQWSKTLSPANIAQKRFRCSIFSVSTFYCKNTPNDMKQRQKYQKKTQFYHLCKSKRHVGCKQTSQFLQCFYCSLRSVLEFPHLQGGADQDWCLLIFFHEGLRTQN